MNPKACLNLLHYNIATTHEFELNDYTNAIPPPPYPRYTITITTHQKISSKT